MTIAEQFIQKKNDMLKKISVAVDEFYAETGAIVTAIDVRQFKEETVGKRYHGCSAKVEL